MSRPSYQDKELIIKKEEKVESSFLKISYVCRDRGGCRDGPLVFPGGVLMTREFQRIRTLPKPNNPSDDRLIKTRCMRLVGKSVAKL